MQSVEEQEMIVNDTHLFPAAHPVGNVPPVPSTHRLRRDLGAMGSVHLRYVVGVSGSLISHIRRPYTPPVFLLSLNKLGISYHRPTLMHDIGDRPRGFSLMGNLVIHHVVVHTRGKIGTVKGGNAEDDQCTDSH
jgi:hypothetical protein